MGNRISSGINKILLSRGKGFKRRDHGNFNDCICSSGRIQLRVQIGQMLKVGEIAPEFMLKDQSGSLVSLTQLLAKGDLVLYFYPADFTRICTSEACAFRDAHDDLSKVPVQIVGISPQGVESHSGFASQYSLRFSLLCDEGKEVIRAYGVDGPFGFGVRRVTFYIDSTKRIKNRVVADLSIKKHMEMIKAVIGESGGT